jgi:hypothetical protein
MAAQVPASPPIRAEIRLGGRIRFTDNVYDVRLEQDEESGVVTFTASLRPTLVDAPPVRPREVFGSDPRDGTDVILQAHSGRRDTTPAAPRAARKPRKQAVT